jgi:DNA-binding CsgD family transcriptional regulator
MNFDTSRELLIRRHLHGIQLQRPNDATSTHTDFSVQQALDFPCNVYFLDTTSTIQNINEYSALSCGYDSSTNAIGSTVFDVLPLADARALTNVDQLVAHTNRAHISDDSMHGRNDELMNFLTIKTPIYNSRNDITGIFGCSVLLGQQPIAKSLSLMTELGLLQVLSSAIGRQRNKHGININLSKREHDVLHYFMRGLSAKEIGGKLNISNRTVEHHIAHIKDKAKCSTRSELFDKYFDK